MDEKYKNPNLSCKVFVRTFPGAITQHMDDYVEPSIRPQTDRCILHVGMNDWYRKYHQMKLQEKLLI